MPNSVDFRADQIQTKQIIVTGSGAGTTKLLIYGIEAQGSPVNEGLINQTVFPSNTTIGSDVFLYVSGAVNTKGSATVRGTSVFGGDLVVSGSLYNGLVRAASGDYSHAEGNSTIASANFSHAEGESTIASGSHSHTEGQATIAYGESSHAEGYLTIAFGTGSHASGIGTIASGSTAALSNASIVQAATGRWNKRDNTTSLFVVGNGTGDSNALRGDIFRAESTGELVLSGGIRHACVRTSLTSYPMTRNTYINIIDTYTISNSIDVFLPEITSEADIGLTYIIKQLDNDVNTNIVTIRPSALNSLSYYIYGFNLEFGYTAGMILTTLGTTKAAYNRRSITLTYTGYDSASAHYRWTVMATSEC